MGNIALQTGKESRTIRLESVSLGSLLALGRLAYILRFWASTVVSVRLRVCGAPGQPYLQALRVAALDLGDLWIAVFSGVVRAGPGMAWRAEILDGCGRSRASVQYSPWNQGRTMKIDAGELIPAIPADLSKDASGLAHQTMAMGMVLATGAMNHNLADSEIERREKTEARANKYLEDLIAEKLKNAELTIKIFTLEAQLKGDKKPEPTNWDEVGSGVARVVGAGMGAYALLGGYIESLRGALAASSPDDPKLGIVMWSLRWFAALTQEEKTELLALLLSAGDGAMPAQGRRRILAQIQAGASDPSGGAAVAELVALLQELGAAAQLAPDQLAGVMATIAMVAQNMAGSEG